MHLRLGADGSVQGKPSTITENYSSASGKRFQLPDKRHRHPARILSSLESCQWYAPVWCSIDVTASLSRVTKRFITIWKGLISLGVLETWRVWYLRVSSSRCTWVLAGHPSGVGGEKSCSIKPCPTDAANFKHFVAFKNCASLTVKPSSLSMMKVTAWKLINKIVVAS